ncbi:MAG TPA: hypothetical protein VE591_12850 [Candidatus Acidoferrum sp.]|nr:hypothetical protein [Candidatus Acidoferrum sp.]
MLRHSFLAAGVSGVAAATVLSRSDISAAAAPTHGSLRFDPSSFYAVLQRPYRHKQVFASTKLENGLVLHYMENSLKAYADGFAEGPGTLHVAAVLYGPALVLALSDAMWQKYGIADAVNNAFGETLDTNETRDHNPFAASVAVLVKHGASVFVCNNALGGDIARVLARRANNVSQPTDAQRLAVHDDLARNVLPGAMIVPAGVAALNACQEAKFTLVQATTS